MREEEVAVRKRFTLGHNLGHVVVNVLVTRHWAVGVELEAEIDKRDQRTEQAGHQVHGPSSLLIKCGFV